MAFFLLFKLGHPINRFIELSLIDSFIKLLLKEKELVRANENKDDCESNN